MRKLSAVSTTQSGDLGHRSSGLARASVSGVLWSLVNASVSTLLAALVFLVTSRILAPSDFGAVAFAVAIITLVGTLIPTAFADALVQRAELTSDHLDTVFWLTMVPAALGYAGLALLAPAIAGWSDIPLLAAILPVLALRLVFDAGLTIPSALITRRMHFRYIAIRTTIANGLGAVICLWLIFQGFALWALVISQVAASLAGLVVSVYAAGWRPRVSFRLTALRDLRGFGLYAMGGRLLSEARIDQFMLGLLLGPQMLGFFYFSRRLFVMLRDLTAGAFGPVTNVLLASLQGDRVKRQEAYLAASYASAGMTFPFFAGLLAIAPTAIPFVFGPQWTEAVFAVQCFSVIGILTGLGVLQAALIRNLGRPDWWFWYQATMQLSTIPIVLVMFRFGLDAIMAAIVVRTVVLWPFSVRMAQRMLDMPLASYLNSLRGPAFGAGAIVLAVGQVPVLWPGLATGFLLLLQVATGVFVYGLVLTALSHERMREMLGILRSKRQPVL